MRAFGEQVIRFRWPLLAGVVLATAVLGYSIRNTASNYDYEAWLPEGDEVAERIKEVDRTFSATMVMFVILDFGDRGVFDPESLALVDRITAALEQLDGLADVTGLLNAVDIRRIEDGVRVGKLVSEIPRTEEGMGALRSYVLGREPYVGTLVSADGRFTVLVVRIDASHDELKVAAALIARVKEIAGDQPCHFGGDPAVALAISQYSNQDLLRLLPAMVGVMVLVLGFGLHRVSGVVLPLSFVMICIVWTFGLKALLGYPFNMLSPPVAVMLMAIGSDYAVHIYNHFLKRGEIVTAMAEITPPVVMSALTTVIGLLAFSVTGIPNLTYFGIELALGLASACLISVILLPISIHLLRVRPGTVRSAAGAGGVDAHVLSRGLYRLGGWVHRRPGWVLALTCGLMGIMAVGIARITTAVDLVQMLPEESSPRQGNEVLEGHFGGMYANTIYFQGDLGDPAVLARQLYLENFLRSQPRLSSFHSINGYVAELHALLGGVYAVPETREGVSGLWLLLEDEGAIDTLVTPERDRGLITAFIRGSDTGRIKRVSERVREFFDAEVSDTVVRVDPARLSPAAAAALREFRVRDAARQLVWLGRAADRQARADPDALAARLTEALPAVERAGAGPAVLAELRGFLRAGTVEALPVDLVDALMETVAEHGGVLDRPEMLDGLERRIAASGGLDAGDARLTVEELAARADSALRLERAGRLWASVAELLHGGLRENEHYEKRARGVLWELLGPRPVLFAAQAAGIPEIGPGVVDVREVRVRQAGFPEIILRLEEVLLRSQYSSLLLASAAVFLLVSLSQISLRRGLACLLSVLVPLELVLGMMGWVGIPLDFGTVLNGAMVVGLGIDGSIHFLHYYHRLRAEIGDRGEALRCSMAHVGRAVITANATTCAGFLVLLFAHTSAVRNFALTTGMAIVLVTVSVLTFLPALVVLLGVAAEKGGRGPRGR